MRTSLFSAFLLFLCAVCVFADGGLDPTSPEAEAIVRRIDVVDQLLKRERATLRAVQAFPAGRAKYERKIGVLLMEMRKLTQRLKDGGDSSQHDSATDADGGFHGAFIPIEPCRAAEGTEPLLTADQVTQAQRRVRQVVQHELPHARSVARQQRQAGHAAAAHATAMKLLSLIGEKNRLMAAVERAHACADVEGAGTDTGDASSSTPTSHEPTPPVVNGPAPNAADFACDVNALVTIAESTSRHKVDRGHDALLRCLLFDQPADRTFGLSDEYRAALKKNLSGERFLLTSQQDVAAALAALPQDPDSGRRVVTSFVRDAFKVLLDVDAVGPDADIVIDDVDINDDTNVFARDSSSFVRAFDAVVAAVNNRLPADVAPMKSFAGVAHRDAVQLIPRSSTCNCRAHYIGYRVRRTVTVSNLHITSPHTALQGIFVSDGAFQRLVLVDNVIDVGGKHMLSFNGLMTAHISGNTDGHQRPLVFPDVKLLPLRLGGGSNLYVTSFHPDSEYSYGDVTGDVDVCAIDHRRHPNAVTSRTGHATHWRDVHMEQYQKAYGSAAVKAQAVQERAAAQAAKDAGQKVTVWGDVFYRSHAAMKLMVARGLAAVDDRAPVASCAVVRDQCRCTSASAAAAGRR